MAQSSKPTRRLRRAIFIGVLAMVATVGALLLYFTSDAFKQRVRREVITQLEDVTGGKVELKNVTWSLSKLEIGLDDLTVHGLERPDDVPYAHVDHVRISFKVLSWMRREFGLRELDAQRPVLHLIIYPNGSTNQPRPKLTTAKPGSQQLFDIRVDRVAVSDALLVVNDNVLRFDMQASSLLANMRYRGGRDQRYSAQLQVGNLQLKRSDTLVLSQVESSLVIANNRLEVESLRWSSGKSQLQASGVVSDFAKPKVTATYSGALELSRIGPLLGAPEMRDGTANLAGTIRYISTEDFFSSGTVSLGDGSYSTPGLRLNSFSGRADYTVDVDRITLNKINGSALGGSFSGHASVMHWAKFAPKTGLSAGTHKQPPAKLQQGSLSLEVSRIELASALRALLPNNNPLNRLRIASEAQGKVELSWTGSPRSGDTLIDLQVQSHAATSASELPLSGSIAATYHGSSGQLSVAGVNLAGRATRLSASGAIGRQSQMRVSLNTSDLSELTPVMQALGSSEGPLPAILHGQASFNGSVSGTLLAPTLSGHLQATNFDTVLPSFNVRFGAPAASANPASPTRQIHWDSLVADVAYSQISASARNVVLRRGKAKITGSEVAGLVDGQLEPDSPLQIHLGLQNTDLGDLQDLFGASYPITGTFSGEMVLTGTKENLDATGQIRLTDGAIYGEPYRAFSANLQLQNNEAYFRNIVLQQDGGRITGTGSYNLDSQAFTVDVAGNSLELAHITRLRNSRFSLAGRAEFSATGAGTLAQPSLNAKFSIAGLTVNGESAGDLVATAQTRGSTLHVEAHTNTALAAANVNGDIGMTSELPAEMHLDLTRLDVDPVLRAYLPAKLTGHSSISGKFLLRGPLRHPHEITVTADVDQFLVDIQNLKLQNQGPLRFSLNKEVVTIDQLHIVGNGTDVTGSGKVEFSGAKRVDLHGNGQVNLAVLHSFNPNISSSGQMTFTVNTTGNVSDPNFAGNVQIANGAIALADLPNGLSELNGTLSFDRNRLRVQRLTGKTGGGDLVLGGYITYANGVFFDLTGSGRDIRIRYPEGVSSQATADVRLVGTLQNSLLSGDVTITKFGLTPQFDLAAYVQRAKQPPAPPGPNSLVDNVRLDLHITSTPELRVETSMARLAGDVDMRLRGTAARPAVVGRVSIAEGDITFNSTTYHLERGDIVFTNPVRIEPVVNVEASARVRDYDITLGFHGTPEKLNVTYRSEPPLPSADIIALLAFGRTRQESEIQAEQGSQAASAQSFAQTASNAILGEALNSAVSSRVQKLFGISRIKIDPNLGGTEDNPNARLTIEQQISKDVTVTYLTNLGQYAEEVLQVEYNINKSVSLVAVRDYTGVLAIDLRIRQRKR